MQTPHHPSCPPPGRATAQALFHFLSTWRRRVGAVLALLLAQLLLAGAAQAQAGNVVADPGFNSLGTGADGPVLSIAVQPNGQVLIGGWFTRFNDTSVNYMARLHANGMLDTSFNNLGAGATGLVYSIAVQSNNQVLIGGAFSRFNGTLVNGIARLHANGTLDDSFNDLGAGVEGGSVRSIAVQPNNQVLIGGTFTQFNGASVSGMARLNDDGTLDTNFNNNLGAGAEGGSVRSIAVQPNNQVLIGGTFTQFNGASVSGMARLNDDGTLDTNFNNNLGTGASGGSVYAIAVQPNNQVLIGGTFTHFNGTPVSGIARLHANGKLDPSFNNLGTGATGGVESIAVQSNNQVLIGGAFTHFNGTPVRGIARLHANGTLDDSFNPGTGADGWVESIALQPDGKVLIGGYFTDFNGTTSNFIARLVLPRATSTATPVPTLGSWALLGLLGVIGLWGGLRRV